MSKFKKFVDEKKAELEGMTQEDLSFDSASLMGIKSITSRQPANTHAMLNFLDREIPLSSKGEIIYEAILQAFNSVFVESSAYSQAQFNIEVNHIANELTNSGPLFKDKKSFLSSALITESDLDEEQINRLYDFYKSLGGDK